MGCRGLFSILLIEFYLGLVYAECPDGWTVFSGSCYLFPQQQANFLDANRHCNLLESHLVNIGSAKENSFVKSFVSAEKDHLHWIGLNDIAVENVWAWVDTNKSSNFTDWAPGQPDGITTQNCVILHSADQYQWHDQGCSVLQHFICELPQRDEYEVIG